MTLSSESGDLLESDMQMGMMIERSVDKEQRLSFRDSRCKKTGVCNYCTIIFSALVPFGPEHSIKYKPFG